MGVVDETVENGVGNKPRIAYRGMPALDRDLTRDDVMVERSPCSRSTSRPRRSSKPSWSILLCDC